MLKKQWIAALLTVMLTSTAWAHDGPRVWVDQAGGRVVTLTSNNDLSPSVYTPSRLFEGQFGYDSFNGSLTEFPGFEAPRGTEHHLANNTSFGFNITRPALFYDTTTQTFLTTQDLFGSSGVVPQIGLGLGFELFKTADGPVSGTNLLQFNATGDMSNEAHSHFDIAELGNGNTVSPGPAGIYALALELTSPTLATSEEFFILFGTAGSQTAPGSPLFSEAKQVALQTLVPEPVSILLVMPAAMLLRRRR